MQQPSSTFAAGGDPNISAPMNVTASISAISSPAALPGTSNGNAPEELQRAPMDPSIYPGGSRSLSNIGLTALCLGMVLSAGLLLTLYCIVEKSRLWRLALFLSTLSLFHFLEFYTTARYNTINAKASSFILFTNGKGYNFAQASALTEILVGSLLFPGWQDRYTNAFTIGLGLALVVVGQGIRSLAMVQAGTNFNHIPKLKKEETHKLVTTGIYGLLRHPSYFGFFWFSVGSQILVGNKICTVAYVFVLWMFFSNRIRSMYKRNWESRDMAGSVGQFC